MPSDRWNAAVIDGAKFSIISTDTQGIISTFNRAAEKLLGYQASEVVGISTPEIIHDPNEVTKRAKELSHELNQTILPGIQVFTAKALIHGSDIYRWTYIRKDGARIPVRLSVTAIYGEKNELMGFLGIAEDITEDLQMELQLAHSAKMLSLGEMAGGVAHEINNPLAIIRSKVELLRNRIKRNQISNEIFDNELQKIEKTTERVAKIIRGLRNFSRNSEHDPLSSVPIKHIIEETIELCKERFSYSGIHLQCEIRTDELVECKPSQISQVLMNLLNNSYDAVQSQDSKWVRIEVDVIDEFLHIAVTDCGAGIAKDIQEKLMQPFFTTKEVGLGKGLGLSISKGIINDHGGTLEYLQNVADTCFLIRLPLRQIQVQKKM